MIIITNRPEKLYGELSLPGDKSITHRAAIIGSLARGITEVKGFLDADDCRSTVECLQKLGVKISERSNRLLIEGRNMALDQPRSVLNAGNSGTTARLLLGILAGQAFSATVSGDQSLQKRPMDRVIEPLSMMGAVFEGAGRHLPLSIRGGQLRGLTYKSPRASAQVKSAVLLAGLFAEGETVFDEPSISRNHTELMLNAYGANIFTEGTQVRIKGGANLRGGQILVPGDISTAAFFMVAAAIVPGSEILLKDVGINPTRSGIIDVLLKMGVNLEISNERTWGNEPVADILVSGGALLKGVQIGGEIIPRLIDEIPIIAVAAALAEGKTVISDAGELRVKESDRISALAGQLSRLGAVIVETEDGFVIEGVERLEGAEVESLGDHRIAMAMAVAGLAAEGDTAVHGAEAVTVSYPGFMAALRALVTK
jgi:3-phosphoshikimate 1-carboxyvinyltransferase